MWNYMEKNPDLSSPTNDAGVERVRSSNGRYAFLIESTNNEYISNHQPCKCCCLLMKTVRIERSW